MKILTSTKKNFDKNLNKILDIRKSKIRNRRNGWD